jgi:hypothetical protein
LNEGREILEKKSTRKNSVSSEEHSKKKTRLGLLGLVAEVSTSTAGCED